jgi:hypothetical protein
VAVAYDANSTANGTTSISWTHTPVGTPAGVYVFVSHCGTTATNGTNSNDVTGVTYGGIPMTLVQSRTGDGTNLVGMVACYFLGLAVPSGAQTIVVTGGSTSKYCFAKTVTAATRNTKIQNSSTIATTSYTKNTTVNAGTISKSGVSCLQDTVVLNSQTAVGRSSPLTSPAYSVDGTHERDWGVTLTGVYRLTAVNTTDTQTGFIGTTDTGTGYYILIGICVAETSVLAHRQTDSVNAGDSLAPAGIPLLISIGGTTYEGTQNGTAGATFTITGVTAGAGTIVLVEVAGTSDNVAANVSPVSVSGGGLTWSSAVAESSVLDGNRGTWTGFFWAYTASGISGQTLTVTHSDRGAGNQWLWGCALVISNADTSTPVGATATNSNASSQPATVTIDFSGTGRTSSLLLMTAVNWQLASTNGSVDANSTLVESDGTGTNDGWVQRRTALVGAGSYTLSRTLSAADRWGASGVEIKALTAGAYSHTQQDTARASDNVAQMVNPVFGAIPTDTARANDQLGIAVVKNVLQADNAAASDTIDLTLAAVSGAFSHTQQDNAQASDSEAAQKYLPSMVLDGERAQASDSESAQKHIPSLTLSVEIAQASDSEAAQKHIPSLGLSGESAQASDGTAAQKFIPALNQADNALASDIVAAGLLANVAQADTAQATDTWAFAIGIASSLTDAVIAGDAEALALVKVVAQSDSAVALDSWGVAVASTAGAYSAVQTDNAVASDAFAAAGGTSLLEFGPINVWNGSAWVHWTGGSWT